MGQQCIVLPFNTQNFPDLVQPFTFKNYIACQIWRMHLQDADDAVLKPMILAARLARILEKEDQIFLGRRELMCVVNQKIYSPLSAEPEKLLLLDQSLALLKRCWRFYDQMLGPLSTFLKDEIARGTATYNGYPGGQGTILGRRIYEPTTIGRQRLCP